MRIINAHTVIYKEFDEGMYILKKIERIGRTCYKSEENITGDSAERFVRGLIKRGHEAMLEHASITVKFIVDRGVSHEIVRHRVASFAQESTRYCNYSQERFKGELTFIKPCFFEENSPGYTIWLEQMKQVERAYFKLLDKGYTAEKARTILPNSLKTELIMTANLREWRHFFKLRACNSTGAAHPQMLEVTRTLLDELKELIPVVFDDMGY